MRNMTVSRTGLRAMALAACVILAGAMTPAAAQTVKIGVILT